MAAYEYDVVVIGSGPAGEGAAMNAAKKGRRVAVIEEQSTVGGNCTHKGTIPSKALRHSVKQIIEFNTNPMFRDIGEPRWFSFPKVLSRAEKVISNQVMLRTNFYARNRVDLFFGEAKLVSNSEVSIVGNNGSADTLKAKNIIIATGSSPYCPPDVDFNHPRIYNSDTVLKLCHTPRNMVIYGAGVIGCEYASIFSGLGVKVDLIDNRDRLLSFLDGEISDALSYHLRNNGVMIRHNEEYDKIEGTENGVVITMKSGKVLRTDAFLWCNGRTGNTAQLDLDKVGLKANGRGQLDVDDHYRTEVDGIYAVGDVIGWPGLASAALDQGRAASEDMLDADDFRFVSEVPSGIYTIPEISSIGKTEEELTSAAVPYEVGQAFFKDTARAQISGEPVGMLKILFHRESLEILGIHCFGDQASEIIHIGQAIMAQEGEANTVKYFVNTTFNYPTMAEAYRVAALAGLNRLESK
ncbi:MULTISPECIES: Si-specific NAD(P)(+) transhydrogenase [unclassified Marinobacterium]|jgi:NAD(P) transhydrogenase|uniref:Si-specific NAD(P)(+) transhydrogenase n=1 Tax=unclassified Marinobacterium TaxID=2644139 RepID=UPI001569158E|nr:MULTISPECIES: Si-specific NAD(P)(+) transhydrogenase [unclassified Marinobacterium]NRP11022.1 Soluble pyridine nucleotide transhydrogenase [Marinobacterium sp. xm-g-48]NRP27105.1 Soluble pyridine nucleotide transhydrogenase [Marinobacterium sp. xm-d-420]NRP36552.1 Soluble pyridine nucleotide transhydrogenase [Marinobacterium sp. xm-d-579]NRP39061.1 Soluble pyridine nucleotide transhydrogenase [Marinobacterium sp. xm-a-121]NRP48007.1 Soluble pyridine nucleotide transhydrogenase [Marinobacter